MSRESLAPKAGRPIPLVERPVGDSPDSGPASRRRIRRRATMDDLLMGVILFAGSANIIMQLARPGVGYGVLESRVESGRFDLHPLKRARTTFTYIAAAIAGTEAQRSALRRAVNSAHARVYSTPESPVSYRAFNQELQLWVAACIYKGFVDVRRLFIGEMNHEEAERYHREAMTLGTTLQVPRKMWPKDRAAFDRYWQESLEKVRIDRAVREYLYPLAVGRYRGLVIPRPLRRWAESRALLVTTGFLPQRFRDEMGLRWDGARQQRFDRLMALVRAVNGLMPRPIRRLPFNLLLWDLERRMRTGRPLV